MTHTDRERTGLVAWKEKVVQALNELTGPHGEEWIVEKTDLCKRLGIDPEELEDA